MKHISSITAAFAMALTACDRPTNAQADPATKQPAPPGQSNPGNEAKAPPPKLEKGSSPKESPKETAAVTQTNGSQAEPALSKSTNANDGKGPTALARDLVSTEHALLLDSLEPGKTTYAAFKNLGWGHDYTKVDYSKGITWDASKKPFPVGIISERSFPSQVVGYTNKPGIKEPIPVLGGVSETHIEMGYISNGIVRVAEIVFVNDVLKSSTWTR